MGTALIVCGSRGITDLPMVRAGIERLGFKQPIEVIVAGACPNSPDVPAMQYAAAENIQYVAVPARWEQHGRQAGPIRNRQMAAFVDEYAREKPAEPACVAFWDGRSRGTRGMMREAEAVGIPVYCYLVNLQQRRMRLIEPNGVVQNQEAAR